MSTVTCALLDYDPVDMEMCRGCFYRRLPDDISTVFCRKPIYDARRASFEHQLKMMRWRYVQLDHEKDICRRSGRIQREEQITAEQRKLQTEAEAMKATHEAAAAMVKQAVEINDPRVTAAEEYLYENKKPFRVLLDAGRDLDAFLLYIKEKNVQGCDAVKEAAGQFFA